MFTLSRECRRYFVAVKTADRVSGKTIRWVFTDGPAKGTHFEHVFAEDGSVTFRGVDEKSGNKGEVAQYGSERVSDDVSVVSYRSKNGYTLTVVLNFADHQMVAFASNSEQWFQQKGTFEVVD
jgi:hypothetical protein